MDPELDERFRTIAEGIYLEGLAVDGRRGAVWYSDVIAGGVHGVQADGTTVALNPDRLWTGGIMLNEDGAILSTGAGGIMWNRPESGESGWLLREAGGAPINGINEMAPDGDGGLYFGTVDIERVAAGEPPRPSAIWRLTRGGEATRLTGDLGFANGMVLSPDGGTLYYNDTFDGVYALPVRGDGTLGERRRLLAKEDCDGMAIDAEGTLWITGFRSSAVVRLRPDGTVLAPVPMPADAVTQVRFGGSDGRDLYVTAVPGDGGEQLKAGVQPTAAASRLYLGRSDVAGAPIAETAFRIG